MKSCFQTLSLIFLIIVIAQNAYASSVPEIHKKPVRTNLNEVSGEFEEHIENKALLDSNVEDLKSRGISGIEVADPSYILGAEDGSKVSSESSRLSSISEYDLEDAGRRERANPKNSYFDDFETDYTKPGASMHKKDAEEIISATNIKLGELTRALKDIGIDCREVSKDRDIKDPYLIELEREEVKEVDYDKTLCEQVKNNYSCTSSFKATCRHKYSVPLEESRFLTALPKSYDARSGILTFGWLYNFTQPGGHGTQYDYKVSFRIDALEAVSEFALKEVGYDDFVRVTINGYQIFAGPFGGDRLELLKDKTIWDRTPGFPYFGVAIDGSGRVHCADQFEWRVAPTYVDLRRFLKEGNNSIDIRLIVGGGGGIWLKFSARVNECNSWNETWEEQCTHRN